MTIQDHSDTPDSSTLLPGGNKVSLDAAAQIITSEGHVPKLRKPYTITKQRERWAEDEHKKFLEALKLYGRAWRKIEDHVGTKTAVQIRSHAQKFFSKVVRESNDSNTSSIRATEIPPPRPKRKPMHPYPRKLVIPVKKDTPLQEQSAISASPNSSFDQEHQSPTSVLCVFPSETLGSEDDSGTPDGSSSPISSPLEERELVSVKLELSPKLGAFTKEGSLEATSPKTLKLFGKTMLLDDPEKSAASYISLDQQQVAPKFIDFVPFPFFPLDNMNSMKVEDEDKETCKSWSSFNAGSVKASGNCQMSENTETQFHEYSLELTRIQQSLAHVSQPKLSGSLKRSSSEKYTRGFVPYKRSLSEKGTQSSTTAGALNIELQRTRLCF